MRRSLLGVGIFALITASVSAQQSPNPLFAPPTGDPFGSTFYTAPGTRTLPNGTEAPIPPPEAVLGPGENLGRERVWASVDFLYAASSRTLLPPLVTSSLAGAANAGALGRESTTVVFGGNQLSDLRPALRADAGVWLTERFGFDGSFLTLFEESEAFVGTATPGGTILARPVVSGAVGETAVPVSVNGRPGTIRASADTFFVSGDVNLRLNVSRGQFSRLDVFAGYRYSQLRDGVVVITERFNDADVRLTDEDLFRTRNEFHGPQVGVATTHRLFDRLTLSTRLAVAMGVTFSDTTIGVFATGGEPRNTGLLASGTNIGRSRDSFFAVLPSADARLGYDVFDWLRFSVGYTFAYWSRVERAADQIDRTILSPGRPAYPNYTTDYWLQGVTLGAELRY